MPYVSYKLDSFIRLCDKIKPLDGGDMEPTLRLVNIFASIGNRNVMELQKKETEVKCCSRRLRQYKRTLMAAERMFGFPRRSQGLD